MHKLALILIWALSLASGSAFAASYQQIDGTIVDPILVAVADGQVHPYSGTDLVPWVSAPFSYLDAAILVNANLSNAILHDAHALEVNLTGANLDGTDLTNALLIDAILANATLTGGSLFGATLWRANLSGANLSDAELSYANLTDAVLTGANLQNAVGLGSSTGAASDDINTDFTGTGFDPVAAGWTLVPVPEPSTALLMGLGLAGLASRRR